MKYILIALFILSPLANAEFTLFHYNIKELDTKKLEDKDRQLEFAKEVMEKFKYDILSINEMQYDLPKVPTPAYKTKGKNLKKLGNILGLKDWNQVFFQANTGNNAKKKSDGTYAIPGDPDALKLADQENFGLFPGQYSTGALFKYKKVNTIEFHNIGWKDFNPNRDLTPFRLGNGEKVPETIYLFDKNITDVTLEIEGQEVHVVLLHTVPSYHFGNKQTVNYVRNADQLRFLEWYLTGKTDFPVKLAGIQPLPPGTKFITVGDFNTDLTSDNPGTKVLNNLFKKIKIWVKDPDYTNEGGGFKEKPFRLMLDYIGYSEGLELLDGGIHHPSANWEDLGCGSEELKMKANPKRVKVKYKNENGKECNALVDRDYYITKMASDHFPIWAKFKLKK